MHGLKSSLKGKKMNKIGRNDPCPCGSGLKYKKCCLDKNTFEKLPYSLNERTLILYKEMVDVFGLNKVKKWNDIKKFITGDRISYFHKVIASLWPPDTNLETLLPKHDDGKLRALYMGRDRPDLVLQNIVRYTLYTDEILILLPFQNPWSLKPKFNPVENPDQFKSYMLQNIDFVQRLAPWIISGHVKLIPDPGDFDYDLRMKTMEMAENNKVKLKFNPEDIPEDYEYLKGRIKPFIMNAPEEYLRKSIQQWRPGFSSDETDKLIESLRKSAQNDPYTISEPIAESQGQLLISKCGTSLEMGLYICNLTGAYMYTDWKPKWDLILSSADSSGNNNVWSPLTKAFQNLNFKFLNNVDPNFACSLRNDGRLENFRSFLRKTWNELKKEDVGLSDSSIGMNFADELKVAYAQASSEWESIDKNLLQRLGVGGAVSAILSGGMNWEIPASGFAISGVTSLLAAKYDRKRFKTASPMSVLIDLEKT